MEKAKVKVTYTDRDYVYGECECGNRVVSFQTKCKNCGKEIPVPALWDGIKEAEEKERRNLPIYRRVRR